MASIQKFHIPFCKDTPKVTLGDGILFIPPTADRRLFSFPEWDSSSLFEHTDRPIHIEFCSGNGSWIIEKALKNPEINWVAVEKRFDRVRTIWRNMKRAELKNLLVVFGEALAFSTSYIPTSSVSALYINFPDPWPKRRHIKNRIISPLFMNEAARILNSSGKLIFVTDDRSYSDWFLEQYSSWNEGHFEQAPSIAPVSSPPEEYGSSFFDTLFREQGKSIFYHERQRIESNWKPRTYDLPSTGVLGMNAYTIEEVRAP